ncbi:MAG: DNA gyrase subunit A [Oscillospiraceae bacterium]|jgi:DNA gyrase subunit A|nr:DNA gyrase subunit A [Oscillospiraceae bacterium]
MQNNEKIVVVDIRDEMKRSFLDYSMSVIVSRALPDARDGLKPVHRRILYTLFENNLTSDKPYRKCADTVGSVLGRYHPHGDASVYDALVRMAQNFSTRYMLIDGHGNFGSVDGDPPAAYRYTEARMSKIASEVLADIDKETVDFIPNYDDRLKEPTVLPARFPNLLMNGSTGIAVGMATNIPPHNLGETIDAICCLIDNPDADFSQIMKYIKGPDFPTGGLIMGLSGIISAYTTGKGKITVRAKTEIIEDSGRYKITVTEIPYQVNKSRLIENIATLIRDKKLDGISKIEDHSDRKGMSIEISIKQGFSPQIALNQLFSFSQMQTTFGVIMLAIVKGEPKVLNLKECLKIYIDFQVEIITRRTQFDLRKTRERAHILEGLKIAIDNIDKVISILRSSKSISEGKQRLSEEFNLSDIQTQAIVQMPLGRLTGLEREKIEGEIVNLLEKITYFESILSNPSKLLEVLKEEILKIKLKYVDKRRTEIIASDDEVNIEDLVPHEERVITLTELGYIKTQDMGSYKLQKRGGQGVRGMTRRESDVADRILMADSHDYILFFSNSGRVYRLKCFEIPEGSRIAKGMNIVNLLPIAKDEKITSVVSVSEFFENNYLTMATKLGVIKKTVLSEFSNVRKSGLIAINLDENDELVWVKITNGDQILMIATRDGKAIRFKESCVRSTGRAARGVKALNLKKNDIVVGLISAENEEKILVISEMGYGRISPASDYRLQSRGGSGVINYHTNKYGKVTTVLNVDLKDDLVVISSDGTIIKVSLDSIRQCARPSKGVRIMKVKEGSKVVAVAKTENKFVQE